MWPRLNECRVHARKGSTAPIAMNTPPPNEKDEAAGD